MGIPVHLGSLQKIFPDSLVAKRVASVSGQLSDGEESPQRDRAPIVLVLVIDSPMSGKATLRSFVQVCCPAAKRF
jgi:hypothetical protein